MCPKLVKPTIEETLAILAGRVRHLESLEPAGAILPDYPWCWLGRTASQSIPDTTWTAIIFDAEYNDPHAMHDNALNPSRIIAPESGVYLATCHIQWTYIPNTGYRFLGLTRNGSANLRYETMHNTAHDATNPDQTIAGLFNLNLNDYLEAWVYHNRGAALTIDQTAWRYPIITVAKVCEL